MDKKYISIDGNTAASNIAYLFSEVAAIYPITPSSPMGELADFNSAKGKKNLFGETVRVIEMQSEGGASGAIHGALSAGAMTTTFTASQGLMLMLPNMHKIAGEMLPTVFHVAARSLACQALSIFADHSDVMSARNTGFALMAASSIQEVQDLAVISHLATMESRIPFLNFFDGFRTSHSIKKIEAVDEEVIKSMLNLEAIKNFKLNSLSPERPMCKVGAENPDVYFQGRETVNKYYDACPKIVKKYMKMFKERFGRSYNLFDYVGAPDAEKIIISMASSNETIHEVVDYLVKKGEKVGLIKVLLYRPFSVEDFISVIPSTVRKIAVLDRTKEPGSIGEPLYMDTVAALKDKAIKVIGGRYGLSSKEFSPAMIKAVFNHLDEAFTHDFTVGINDDVTHKSLKVGIIDTEPSSVVRCKFWGYGSDGTVSANKNSIKIIGANTDKHVQAYFSYDSHKSGGITVSHLRFGDLQIRSEYQLVHSDFIALHKTSYIGHYDILEGIVEGGTFLLNCSWSKEEAFTQLTENMQKTIVDKKINFYVIDANKIAKEMGLGIRINTIMQTAFFKLAGIIDADKAFELMKEAVKKQFSIKGQHIVDINCDAIDAAKDQVHKVENFSGTHVQEFKFLQDGANQFAKDIVEPIMKLKGDSIPVSKMTLDGAIPTETTRLEKRGIANNVPKWLQDKCTQCGFCAMVCPHSAIRMKQIHVSDIANCPSSFNFVETKPASDLKFKLQVYPEDCTGCDACGNCVSICPVKALEIQNIQDARASGENVNVNFFDSLPDNVLGKVPLHSIKGTQLLTPLFELSGACAGCGETPYIKLATQLFGDRMIIANATGCSSIYGGTFPVIPFAKTKEGRGPAWANSLFEDNAEYGFGFRLAIDANRKLLKSNIERLLKSGTTVKLNDALQSLLDVWNKVDEDAKLKAKHVLEALPDALSKVHGESAPLLRKIDELKDNLIDKSVWIMGGDGWAYDIGFGGLDHVLASGENVNVLVLDTEVYSNTGGQCSKATPRAATAKFAVSGKKQPKKDLGRMLTTYGNIYVASISLGANMMQTIKAFKEAEEYDGPSIIIAYSPCIAHHTNMKETPLEEKMAVESGYWPLYRYDPQLREEDKNPMQLDYHVTGKVPYVDFLHRDGRYKSLTIQFPEIADKLFKLSEEDAKWRAAEYEKMGEE